MGTLAFKIRLNNGSFDVIDNDGSISKNRPSLKSAKKWVRKNFPWDTGSYCFSYPVEKTPLEKAGGTKKHAKFLLRKLQRCFEHAATLEEFEEECKDTYYDSCLFERETFEKLKELAMTS